MENNTFLKKYVPVLSMRESQEAQELLIQTLKKELLNNINILIIREPKISSIRQSTNFSSLDGKRSINFDSSNDNNIYYSFDKYKYWLINSIKNLEIKNNNGVMVITNFIDRDSEISNIQSMEKNILQIEYRYDIQENIFSKAEELVNIIYKTILKIENIFYEKYKLTPCLPDKIITKNLDKIIKKMSDVDEIKSDIASEKSAFILLEKIDEKEMKFDYTFRFSLELYSKEIDSSFSIFSIKDRKTLEDLKPFIYKTDRSVEEYRFAKEILKNNDLRTLNIKIDIDALAMVILNKIHILEVQSGHHSDELEKIFNSFGIKHL